MTASFATDVIEGNESKDQVICLSNNSLHDRVPKANTS